MLIQLRISDDEADALREAGKVNSRTLPGEILHRMRAYHQETAKAVETDQPPALAALATIFEDIAENVDLLVNSDNRDVFLSTVQAAFNEVMKTLKVDNVKADKTVVQSIADIVRISMNKRDAPARWVQVREALSKPVADAK